MKRIFVLMCICFTTSLTFGGEDSLPGDDFQGMWEVRLAFRLPLRESDEKADITSKYEGSYEIRFRTHDSGAIQQYWSDKNGEVFRSRGIKVFSHSSTLFEWKLWRDHHSVRRKLELRDDGSAVLTLKFPKLTEVVELIRSNVDSDE